MWSELLVTPSQALVVVISTAGMYWSFVIVVRVLGHRALTRLSSTDLAGSVALGAIVGRAALGNTPVLGAGIVALLTLFAMHPLAKRLQRWPRAHPSLEIRPTLLMAGSEVVGANLHASRLTEDDLWPRLRLAGIRHRSEVACVILEPTGEISVLRRGVLLDRNLFAHVQGADQLPEELFADPGSQM